ncbi:hypothetical protein FNV43_RR18230 [Rhamnella rubrinervis]|uniref:Late embryogenesis abundant protein LEA-2 subgroup domain-containing protein n=1 Tax=Rhamnella rubrinervis TaxID=2594499 RepID=A0A8K0DYM9_9ROSA|nr:hypothetical protein FNV43_RR18230 [Rhamnella rubrinervis]
MVQNEQVRPLAPTTDHGPSSDDYEVAKKLRRRRFIKCCGSLLALIVILAVVVVILIFTVFRVKDPVIRMNKITIIKLELVNNTIPKPGTNITITADVSVKNPNVASFKFSNTTSTLYYHGTVVGEGRGPPGQSKARRTTRMNITVDIITDRMLSNPNLQSDIGSGLLSMNSYSKVPGRVKILNVIKKHVVVTMNCTMSVNITSQAIQQQKCKRKVDL